ncbi:High-affinity fructose transporter ght6 [Fusarium albosuccineum]|uniref:High-affinity fructose transporter ght6 n=1 Tax=Fusarium albosuccineum TaxID=1237068 RepID=A0A8H4PJ53_9HYPO|nr:High-affinity fructose transporter ght6 [Fusarium albosuccineum]
MLGQLSVRINGADCGAEALLLAVITSLGGFLFGYDTGQISGMLLFEDFTNRFAQKQDDGTIAWRPIIQSLLVSLMSIGCLIGALTGSYTADWYGRRKSLSIAVVVFLIGNTLQITATNSWVHMMIGRFVAGFGVGSLSIGVPMFQSECAPREIRGAVVASYQLMISLGILISNIVNYGVREIQESDASWRVIIGIEMAFSLPLGLGVLMLPESPRWLAARDDWEGARLSLARLRGLKDDLKNPLVEDNVCEMKALLDEERKVGQGTWAECLDRNNATPKVFYRTLLGMAVQFLQQWTGVNYFFYYGATIFQSAGIDDPILVQLILGAVNVGMTIPGIYVAERVGRRWPLFFGALWQTAWLIVFASVGTAINPEDSRAVGIIMIVSACLFIASFAVSWGPLGWVVVGELFPLRTRAKQASLATAILISFLTPFADDGISYSFGYVFAGMNFVAALITWFFLYETRTLSLEHIDEMYSLSDLKPWNSAKWTPPGYITRKERDDAYFRQIVHGEDTEKVVVHSDSAE